MTLSKKSGFLKQRQGDQIMQHQPKMPNQSKKVELLSPAGSFESLQAAIGSGADAVYFGVEQLHMRSTSAHAFSIGDIKEISRICRKHQVKAYITLNTVMYEHDMQLLKTILKEVKKQQIDAVIASDFAVIEYAQQMGIPLHISTQANVCNFASVQFFSKFADVIVLARELTLKQVKQITAAIKRKNIKGPSGELLKIELFVHGALCMAVSGKCYLSLHEQNASANRGACVQNCRRPYLVKDAASGQELMIDQEYIFSPKDLCTIDILDQVLASGVTVLKIEGRPKGPDYVQATTRCYREAMHSITTGTYTSEKIAAWKNELEKVYNRGFWEGYYLGKKLGEWTAQPGSLATEKKIYIGRATRYFPKKAIGEFLIESGRIKTGDTLMATGRHFGLVKEKMENLWVNGRQENQAVKGDRITLPIPKKLADGDKLYKIVSERQDD